MENSHVSTQDELNFQYNWYERTFAKSIENAGKDFFADLFSFKLVSLSKNVNVLFQGDEYFVTKIRLDKQHDVFFRCSSEAVKIMLDGTLGSSKHYAISAISDLEAKIISSFNDFLFNHITQFLPEKISKDKRKNFDAINLTFFIKGKDSDNCGKIICTLPQCLLTPPDTDFSPVYDVSNFNASYIPVKIKVGNTKFHLKELKELEKDDIVVFENSNINTMRIKYKNYESDFKLTPNPGIVSSIGDNDEGEEVMEENSQNIWDSIQVDMDAEFDSVKISLGELKNIQAGLVVDLTSIYDNKISLKVENKVIARGELIIINDRYGVKIDETFANPAPAPQILPTAETPVAIQENMPAPAEVEENVTVDAGGENNEEFDYSDFDLDDQDL